MKVLDKNYNLFLVENVVECERVIQNFLNTPKVSIDIEVLPPPKKRNPFLDIESDIVGISFATNEQAFFVFWNDLTKKTLKPLLEAIDIVKITHNWMFDASFMVIKEDIKIFPFEDTYLMAKCIWPAERGLGLKELASILLNIDVSQYAVNFKKIKPGVELAIYGAMDSFLTYKLYEFLEPKIKNNNLEEIYQKLKLVLKNLLNISLTGVKIDKTLLEEVIVSIKDEILTYEKKIFEAVGHLFNLNSTIELGKVLFEEMGLEPIKTTKKKGAPSVDEDSLRVLAKENEIVKDILHHRKLNKLYSTFFEKIDEYTCNDGRIHAVFGLDTESLRVVSRSPNLQNIPRDNNVRKIFIAEGGYKFIKVDFNQAELRMLAEVSRDENLYEAFKAGVDLHSIVAKNIFNLECPWEAVKEKYPELRSKAKGVNFGIIFGITPLGLAELISVSEEEADLIIKKWFESFPSAETFVNKTKNALLTNEFVENIFGIRRRVENARELFKTNKSAFRALLREMGNWIIQSSTALLVHFSLVKACEQLETEGLDCYPVLHLHDGIIFECNEADLEKAKAMIKVSFEDWKKLRVPFVVDIEISERW